MAEPTNAMIHIISWSFLTTEPDFPVLDSIKLKWLGCLPPSVLVLSVFPFLSLAVEGRGQSSGCAGIFLLTPGYVMDSAPVAG